MMTFRSNPQAGTSHVTIYGHTLTNYNDASIRSVNAAKNAFIDFVLVDLDSRFEGFNYCYIHPAVRKLAEPRGFAVSTLNRGKRWVVF